MTIPASRAVRPAALSRPTAAVLLTIALLAPAAAIPVSPAQSTANSSNTAAAAAGHTPTLNVDARLVVVPVTVRDRKGALDTRLTKEDFTLTEDGKPQTIRYFDRENNAPLTVGLLVDVSGSVRSVLDEERDASSAFLDNLLQPDRDKAFIVQFGHQADLLADVTGSLPKLQAGLKRIDPEADRPQLHNTSGSSDPDAGSSSGNPGGDTSNSQGDTRDSHGRESGGHRRGGGSVGGGGTVLYDAIFLSSDEVIQKQKNRKALILLTDGEDRGSKEPISSAIEASQRADATIYAVYFKGEDPRSFGNGGGFPGGGRRGGYPGGSGGGWPGGGSGRGGQGGGRQGGGGQAHEDGKKVLERICDETGGRMFQVSKKEPVSEIYRQIAEELRSQYRLGFTPADNSDGYHRIVVDVPKGKKTVLQARDGYYTGAPAK